MRNGDYHGASHRQREPRAGAPRSAVEHDAQGGRRWEAEGLAAPGAGLHQRHDAAPRVPARDDRGATGGRRAALRAHRQHQGEGEVRVRRQGACRCHPAAAPVASGHLLDLREAHDGNAHRARALTVLHLRSQPAAFGVSHGPRPHLRRVGGRRDHCREHCRRRATQAGARAHREARPPLAQPHARRTRRVPTARGHDRVPVWRPLDVPSGHVARREAGQTGSCGGRRPLPRGVRGRSRV
mmetsp:Transcript_8274/g.25820  ORF Transcript_8274/g.25820 Transcript_8274/m.25820 type:complete len:240 (+) Transcript_8274:387-1106(+)